MRLAGSGVVGETERRGRIVTCETPITFSLALSFSPASSRQLSLLLRSVTNCLPFRPSVRPFVCLSRPLCLFVCLLFAYFYCHASFLCPAVISSDAAAAILAIVPISTHRPRCLFCQPHGFVLLPASWPRPLNQPRPPTTQARQGRKSDCCWEATPNQVQFHVDFQRSSYGFRSRFGSGSGSG